MNNNLFSWNIRNFRKQKNMTQEKVAEILNVSSQTVSRWERSSSLPDITLLPQIAKMYGVTIDDLFTENAVAYGNYAQRLADVYDTSGDINDFIAAETEFEKIKGTELYEAEDYRIQATINKKMMFRCREKALMLYRQAIEKSESDKSRTYWRARCGEADLYIALGKSDEFINRLNDEINHNRECEILWHLLIYTYLKSCHFEEGYRVFKEAINQFYNIWEIYVVGGDICKSLKKYDEAFKYWDKALEIEPHYLDAYYSKANCYEELGNNKEAYEIWSYICEDLKNAGYDVSTSYEIKKMQECKLKICEKTKDIAK